MRACTVTVCVYLYTRCSSMLGRGQCDYVWVHRSSYLRMCQGSFFSQVNPLRRGVVLFLALHSLSSSLSLTVSAIPSHALTLLSSSHLFLVLLLLPWPLVWGTSFSPSLSSLHLFSSAVVPVWDEFLWRDGGGHRTQVSVWMWEVWTVCLFRNWQMTSKIQHVCIFTLRVSPHAFLSFSAFLCVIMHLGVFWFETGSTVTVAISTLGCFSEPHLFFCPSSWPCFNMAEIYKLYRGQHRSSFFFW